MSAFKNSFNIDENINKGKNQKVVHEKNYVVYMDKN